MKNRMSVTVLNDQPEDMITHPGDDNREDEKGNSEREPVTSELNEIGKSEPPRVEQSSSNSNTDNQVSDKMEEVPIDFGREDEQVQDMYSNSYVLNGNQINSGINIIDPGIYSPMIYLFDDNKIIYSDNNSNYVYNINTKEKKNILPYTYVGRNSVTKPFFDIKQNKLKLYNYWITTTDAKKVQNDLIKMFGAENIFITKSLFFRKKNSYMGEKVILISKIPQKPYKFINRLNRSISTDKRTVKSVLGDYIISPDCIFIILSERSIDYICNNYLRYHKEDSVKISALNKSIKSKFTFLDDNETDSLN